MVNAKKSNNCYSSQILDKKQRVHLTVPPVLPRCHVPRGGEHRGSEQHQTTVVLLITAVTALWGERLSRGGYLHNK